MFPDGLPVRGYGVMLLAGIVAGVGMAMYRARQGGLDPEVIISLAIWMVICGVIGARLFYVIEYWEQNFAGKSLRDTLLEIVNVPEGGLVIYGGFIGAAVGFIMFIRKHRLPLLAMADLVAPSMAIGLALGPHRLLSQRLLLRRANRLAVARDVSQIQLARTKPAKPTESAAFQPAVCRPGGPRRDARLSHRSA